MRIFSLVVCFVLCGVLLGAETPSGAQIIAKVNHREITSKDLQLDFFMKQLSASGREADRSQLIQRLIDRELIRQFLEKRKVTADNILLEQQMNMIRRLIEMKGDDFSTVLTAVGLSEESVRQMLALQIAWKTHLTRTLSESRIQKFWQENQSRLDGTEVSASQIFIRIDPASDQVTASSATEKLNELRTQIITGELTFAEAAKSHSQSPSAKTGGDLGPIEGYGSVADEIAEQAFALKPGEISQPFQSSQGLHMVNVRERSPGELSMEDARPRIIKQLSEIMWNEQVARERKSARIQILE